MSPLYMYLPGLGTGINAALILTAAYKYTLKMFLLLSCLFVFRFFFFFGGGGGVFFYKLFLLLFFSSFFDVFFSFFVLMSFC